MIIFIVIFGILAIIGIVASFNIDDLFVGSMLAVNSIIVGFISIGLMVEYLEDPKPEAIEVYRNNTDLQINYKVINNDTIITDSVVIFKQKCVQ